MSKRKILSMALTLCMVAILAIGGTLAFYTDTDDLTNTFTTGKVEIKLDEVILEKDANGYPMEAAEDAKRTEDGQSYKLRPGLVIDKDPTITVEEGSEKSYLGAIVTVKGAKLHDLIGVEGYQNIDITKMASGGVCTPNSKQVQNWNGLAMVYETDDVVIYQDASNAEKGEWKMFIFVKAIKEANSQVVLFDTLTISDEYDNAEMAKLDDLEIIVNAYATQADGFTDCFNALTTAFPEVWKF